MTCELIKLIFLYFGKNINPVISGSFFQVNTSRSLDTLIRSGVSSISEKNYIDALVYLSSAIQGNPKKVELYILLWKSLQEIGSSAIQEAYLQWLTTTFPKEKLARREYWSYCSAHYSKSDLNALVRSHIAHVDDPLELRQLLAFLSDDSGPQQSHPIGVVRYDLKNKTLTGWALDLRAPNRVLNIKLKTATMTATFPASLPCPLLINAGFLIFHGGISIQIPEPLEELYVYFEDAQNEELIGSPVAALPVLVPPMPEEVNSFEHPVDVLVPVYKSKEATLECLESLFKAKSKNKTLHQIIVLNDCSPDNSLTEAIDNLAGKHDFVHIKRPANLGFIRNINRGMTLHPERDVVWLNSDTRVYSNWLDRLRSVAYSAQDVASVTPFTNNGELMSFPKPLVAHPMPTPKQHAELDYLARKANHPPVELVMGCGFCFYIKRSALNDVGYLDEVGLSRGYGEETDWCLRAQTKGWRHMGATHVFVAHSGGHSFGSEKALWAYQNNVVIRQRYPLAERQFEAFVAADPLAEARNHLLNLLEQSKPKASTSNKKSILKREYPELPGRYWLIADQLSQKLGAYWLNLARYLARNNPDIRLLVEPGSPWEVQLLNCSNVFLIPQVASLSDKDFVSLCGVSLALSLDKAKSSDINSWFAAQQAEKYQLPLFAPNSLLLHSLGGFPITDLQAYLPEQLCPTLI